MPGAKITERLDDTHYKGTVTVKVGPATLAFRGDIEVRSWTPATRTLRLIAKGTDTRHSGASMDLTARVEAAEDGASNLVGHSEASVSGKAAAFGGRMMDAVADQVLKQFAANFARTRRRAAAVWRRSRRALPRQARRRRHAVDGRRGVAKRRAEMSSPRRCQPLQRRTQRPCTGLGRDPGLAARPVLEESCMNVRSG